MPGGGSIPLAIDYDEVKRVLRDWRTFSSDHPRHITVCPETDVRDVRQLPVEIDPPEHGEYRQLVDPFFRRPLQAAYREDVRRMVDGVVDRAVAAGPVEAVRELALPIQCRSLARLLGVGDDEAERWQGWGLHVFHEGDGKRKGAALTAYIRQKFAAAGRDGDDFFATLNRATFRGRPLTDAEKEGFANLAFAGGRDTLIQTVASAVGHLADPALLAYLRADEARLALAAEEFIRHLSPIGMLARRCPHGGEVAGAPVAPGGRVAVGYAAANFDERVFERPAELQLDRSPNPHLAFGFGKHHCLGAAQARLVLRCVLLALCARVERIEVVEAEENVERDAIHERRVGFARLVVRLVGR